MGILYFAGAIFFLCAAHLMRVIRWELFISIYEKPNHKNLICALSYGYLLNYFVPFKLGEFVRAWVAGKKMKNGRSLGFSTVIADRYLDILAVGAIYIFLSISGIGGEESQDTALFYMVSAIFLLLLMLIIYASRKFIKKIIKKIASIFNETIESAMLRFAWALIWNFKDIFQKINKMKMIFATLGMWCGYLVSYYFFAAFMKALGEDTTWVDVFVMLFAQNGIKGSTGETTLFRNGPVTAHMVYMVVYMVLPVVILVALSSFHREDAVKEREEDNYLQLLPHMDPKERLVFLENYFSDRNRDYILSYLQINQGISIIRDCSAGSDATTMLCMNGDGYTFFRKYAFGEEKGEGTKLYQQILWIEDNRERIKLPEIIKKEKTPLYCYYDMPYNSNSVGLFEFIHSVPLAYGWSMIRKILESLENSIYRVNVRRADRETIQEYVREKVGKNLDKIKNVRRIRSLQQYPTVFINGVAYKNLTFYEKYLQEDYLLDVFQKDMYAVIHGDLTVENIICTRDDRGMDDFYIIDPNTGNIHDSPNLDYGKLLQSIHGGYEFLMSVKDLKITDNRINFSFLKSSTYMELHRLLKDYMSQKFGYERTKSIYFHEMIHWIRLLPYKIEKDDKRAMLFYAGMLIVMNDVIETYGND